MVGIVTLSAVGCSLGRQSSAPDPVEPAPAVETGRAEPAAARRSRPTPHTEPAPARYGDARAEYLDRLVATMSLEEKVGQLLALELASPATGQALTRLDEPTEALFREVRPGGVALYGSNITNVTQLTTFIDELQATAEIPLLVAIDEEGGLVSRLRHLGAGAATVLPPARDLGSTGDALLAYRAGRALGRELRALGFNMNFAPVLDVAPPEGNPFLESRAYGADPELVARLGTAFLRGLQTHGVAAAVKHFPGHGSAVEDSHYGPATVSASRAELERVHWVPFRRAVAAGTDAVMVAHLAVPALTGTRRPASVAEEVVRGAAREELGFDGIVISDSVTMGGLEQMLEGKNAAVSVVEAGADIVLTPPDAREAHDALLAAVQQGVLTEERIDASVRRVLRVKLDRGILIPDEPAFSRRFRHVRDLAPEDVLAAPEHRRLVETIRRRAAASP